MDDFPGRNFVRCRRIVRYVFSRICPSDCSGRTSQQAATFDTRITPGVDD
jgi:hypothetical protein